MKSLFEKYPLGISLILACSLRSLSAFFSYGPAALDDYNNIIGPALKLIQTGEDLAIPSLRFEIIPYMFFIFMSPMGLLGIDDPRYLVSMGYFCLGFLSLFQVYGIHKLGGIYLNTKWRNLATLIMAIHFISPFLMTRVYLGVFAMTTLIWGVYFSERRKYYLAGLLMSLTVFFRFTLMPLYLIVWVYLFVISDKKKLPTKLIIYYFLGGATTFLFMISSEILTGHSPLETSIQFLKYNFAAHIQTNSYGSMPWLSYFGILLCIFIPPVSVFLVKPFFLGAKKLTLPLLVFLGVFIPHFMLPYKLERFLIPILPMFILMSMKGLELLGNRRLYQRVFRIFFILNLPIVLLVSVSGSEMSSIDGLIYLRKKQGEKFLRRIPVLRWGYYGYDKDRPEKINNIESFSKDIQNSEVKFFYLLNFKSLSSEEIEVFSKNKIICTLRKVFNPSLLERVFIELNPQFNSRRRETVLYHCRNQFIY